MEEYRESIEFFVLAVALYATLLAMSSCTMDHARSVWDGYQWLTLEEEQADQEQSTFQFQG